MGVSVEIKLVCVFMDTAGRLLARPTDPLGWRVGCSCELWRRSRGGATDADGPAATTTT